MAPHRAWTTDADDIPKFTAPFVSDMENGEEELDDIPCAQPNLDPTILITPNKPNSSNNKHPSKSPHQPLTFPDPDSLTSKTLQLSQSHHPNGRNSDYPLTYSHSDLARYKNGLFSMTMEESDSARDWRLMGRVEGCWRRWEEVGGIGKGMGGLGFGSYDRDGEVYKPEMPYVQLIKLVLAASPRKQLTLSQIYAAFEERWPFFQTEGKTWKNSLRHTLSLHGTFEHVERPAYDVASGKGGYWKIEAKPKHASATEKAKTTKIFISPSLGSTAATSIFKSLTTTISPIRPRSDPTSLDPSKRSKGKGKEKEKDRSQKSKRPKTSPFPFPITNPMPNADLQSITPLSNPFPSPTRPDSTFRYHPHPTSSSPPPSYPLPNLFHPPLHPALQQQAQIRLQTELASKTPTSISRQYWNPRTSISPETPLSNPAPATTSWTKIPVPSLTTEFGPTMTRPDWIPDEVVFSHSLPVRSHSYPWKVFPKVRKGWKRDDERRAREVGEGKGERDNGVGLGLD